MMFHHLLVTSQDVTKFSVEIKWNGFLLENLLNLYEHTESTVIVVDKGVCNLEILYVCTDYDSLGDVFF